MFILSGVIILNVLVLNTLRLFPNASSLICTKNHNIFKSEALLYHYFVPDEEHKEIGMTSKRTQKTIKIRSAYCLSREVL